MRLLQYICPILAVLCVLALVTGSLTVFGNSYSPEKVALYALPLLALLIGFMRTKAFEVRAALSISTVCIVLLFFTNIFESSYNLMPFSRIPAELSILFLLFLALSRLGRLPVYTMAMLSPLLLLYCLLDSCQGRILFSDDHATFLYRLIMLKENFPFIPFFNPLWNAGIDERYFFATGTLNIFFLAAPFIYSLDLWQYYTFIPAFILFILTPGSSYLAARLTGGTKQAAALSSILALSSSLGWYHWAVHFGPLGFLTTAALTPLLAALAARLLGKPKHLELWEAISITIVATLVLFWSPGGLIFFPAIFFGLFYFRTLLSKRYVKSMLATLILINLPWVLVFWSASNVGSFLQKTEDIRKVHIERELSDHTPAPAEATATQPNIQDKITVHFEKSATLLHRNLQTAHPLLLFLAIPALLLFPASYRLFYCAMALWLLTLGGILAPLKAQLELDRMIIVLCLFLAVPVGRAIDLFIEETQERIGGRFITALLFSFLLIGLVSTAGILRQRTPVTYSTASPFVHELATQLDTYGETGRVLFTGFVLHDLDGGHLAPLSTLTSTPLIASSQVHKHWKYKDVVPAEYLGQGVEKLEEYFELMNVGALVTTDRTWRLFLLEHPEYYQPEWSLKKYQIFKRTQHQNNYFINGTGTITEQSSHSVTLSLKSRDATLKFNYFPFLRADGCKLVPAEVNNTTTFITLQDCPLDKPITIQSEPAYVRINS